MSDVVQVPVASSHVPCVEVDGELRVVIKPAIETLGISYGSAWNRLRRRSWATIFMTKIVAQDAKLREFATVSIQTWVMFLATVDEDRVPEHLRPLVVEFQRESMQALTDYWTKGFALNSRVTEEQLEAAEAKIAEMKCEIEMHELSAEGEKARNRREFLLGVEAGRNNPGLNYHVGVRPMTAGYTGPGKR